MCNSTEAANILCIPACLSWLTHRRACGFNFAPHTRFRVLTCRDDHLLKGRNVRVSTRIRLSSSHALFCIFDIIPMAPVVLKQLLSKPFGPFRDSEILNTSCKSIRTKPLELKDVILRGDGKIVGYVFLFTFNRCMSVMNLPSDSIPLNRTRKSMKIIRPSKSLVHWRLWSSHGFQNLVVDVWKLLSMNAVILLSRWNVSTVPGQASTTVSPA